MKFDFTKDETLLQWAAKDFADRELALKEYSGFDRSVRATLKKMGQLDFLGLKLPEAYGGDPGSWVMLGLLVEEIAKVNVGLAYFILVTHQVSFSLATYGSPQAKDEWLAGLIKGEKVACICATEPQAGTDLGAVQTKAVKDGDGFRLSGEKAPVSFGLDADVALCLAQTDAKPDQGLTAMLVPLDFSGITKSPIGHMGLYLSNPARFQFDEVAVPGTCILGREGEGQAVNAAAGLAGSTTKIISALISLGMAQAALNLALDYAKKRFAFGKPIAKFEGLSGKLAEDATLIEAARWLCYRALALKDQAKSHAREAAMAGWWCPKIAYQAIHNSLLTHGHAGYSDDHPLQQMLRDVVAFEMISGTEQILKLVISNETFGPVAVPETVAACMADHKAGGRK